MNLAKQFLVAVDAALAAVAKVQRLRDRLTQAARQQKQARPKHGRSAAKGGSDDAEPAVKLHTPSAEAVASNPAPEARGVETQAAGKRLIRLADLFALLDVSKPTGHRLLAAGKVGPRPIRLTPACVRFDGDEVSAWLSTRKPDGNLHDARTWPAVWEMMQRKRR